MELPDYLLYLLEPYVIGYRDVRIVGGKATEEYWRGLGRYQSGIYRCWDLCGNLVREINYRNGKYHGVYKCWDNNGKLVNRYNYVDGTIDYWVHYYFSGYTLYRYNNGVLKSKSDFWGDGGYKFI